MIVWQSRKLVWHCWRACLPKWPLNQTENFLNRMCHFSVEMPWTLFYINFDRSLLIGIWIIQSTFIRSLLFTYNIKLLLSTSRSAVTQDELLLSLIVTHYESNSRFVRTLFRFCYELTGWSEGYSPPQTCFA